MESDVITGVCTGMARHCRQSDDLTYALAGAALGFFSGLKSSSLSLASSGSDADEGSDSSSSSSLSLSTMGFFFAAARLGFGAAAAFVVLDTWEAAGTSCSTDR